jgi:hypothetical protein
MRVLLTGSTSTQTRNKTNIRVFSLTAALNAGLEAGGHTVTWGSPDPDNEAKDIQDYDIVLVGLAPVNSLGARWAAAACGLIGRCWKEGVPVMTFVDDWKVREAQAGLRRFRMHPEKLLQYLGRVQNTKFLPWIEQNTDIVLEAIHKMHDDVWPSTITCLFPWGDHDLIREKTTIYELAWVDPSWMVPQWPITPPTDEDRTREWVLAGLSRYEGWRDSLNAEWPIACYGNMAAKIYPNMVEDKMPNRYAQSWGVLCHKYPHAGSGWWRNRFPFTAMAGSILYGDPQEMAPLGGPYMTQIEEIEALNTAGLRRLANNQRDYLVEKTWTKEHYIDQLTAIIQQFHLTGSVGDVPATKPVMPPPRTQVAREHLANTPPAYGVAAEPSAPPVMAGGSGPVQKVNELGRRVR